MYEQLKECIENSHLYLSPECRKTIFQVMCKNFEEFKFAGSFVYNQNHSKGFGFIYTF